MQDLLDFVENNEKVLKIGIIGDESWVYGYDLKTQSLQWKVPSFLRPKKARMRQRNVKTVFTVFFNYRGIVHYEYVPCGQTMNKEYCRYTAAFAGDYSLERAKIACV